MKYLFLAVGKKHDAKLQAAIDDYSTRLTHYMQAKWTLMEAKTSDSMTEEQVRDAGSAALLGVIETDDTVVLLDEIGQELSSPLLAEKLQTYMNQGKKRVIFVIGGAFGVNQQLQSRANFTWSLSKLVFPHQLVRLILVEQLYRAHSILAGEKYHHQ